MKCEGQRLLAAQHAGTMLGIRVQCWVCGYNAGYAGTNAGYAGTMLGIRLYCNNAISLCKCL